MSILEAISPTAKAILKTSAKPKRKFYTVRFECTRSEIETLGRVLTARKAGNSVPGFENDLTDQICADLVSTFKLQFPRKGRKS